MDENELRRLAGEARQRLAELIPDEQERASADSHLASALREPPARAKPALIEALRSHDAIRWWIAADTDRAASLKGDPISPIGVLYVCPQKDYSVVREVPPGEVLLCPRDDSVLERYDS
jgi:hypothetical protein